MDNKNLEIDQLTQQTLKEAFGLIPKAPRWEFFAWETMGMSILNYADKDTYLSVNGTEEEKKEIEERLKRKQCL